MAVRRWHAAALPAERARGRRNPAPAVGAKEKGHSKSFLPHGWEEMRAGARGCPRGGCGREGGRGGREERKSRRDKERKGGRETGKEGKRKREKKRSSSYSGSILKEEKIPRKHGRRRVTQESIGRVLMNARERVGGTSPQEET